MRFQGRGLLKLLLVGGLVLLMVSDAAPGFPEAFIQAGQGANNPVLLKAPRLVRGGVDLWTLPRWATSWWALPNLPANQRGYADPTKNGECHSHLWAPRWRLPDWGEDLV